MTRTKTALSESCREVPSMKGWSLTGIDWSRRFTPWSLMPNGSNKPKAHTTFCTLEYSLGVDDEALA